MWSILGDPPWDDTLPGAARMTPLPPPNPYPPSWPHCGYDADSTTDPVGCRGIHVTGHTACLAHLADTDRDAYLASLTPGANIDHRGTPFSGDLLRRLLSALSDPTTQRPQLGNGNFNEADFDGDANFQRATFFGMASFDGAQFSGDATFHEAQFSGDAWFSHAQFFGIAGFGGARFSREVWFDRVQFGSAEFSEAQFSSDAWFRAQFSHLARFGGAQFSGTAGFFGAEFSDEVRFDGAQFSGLSGFGRAQFSGHARFREAQFSGDVQFDEVQFLDDVSFYGARFARATELGPFVCANAVNLSGAVFEAPVTLEIATLKVFCKRTRWDSTAVVRLRRARIDLSHAVLSAPVAVTAHPIPFNAMATVDEGSLAGHSEGVRVASIQGVDAAQLVLTDIDLTDCLFSGAFHLDQLRLEGRTVFAPTPIGWHRRGIWPTRWSRRRTLAEEHHWRAQAAGQPALPPGTTPSDAQWRPGRYHSDPDLTPDPEDVAALYRQIRKAFEDGKNEPGAADFYYGECEMRRHDRTGTPPGERRLLWGYWLLSGYGLRASRAMGWLLAAMSLTVLLLMGCGVPTHDPDPATTGTLHGSKISLNTTTPDPALHGGWDQRMTWARAEKATRVAVNSVVFRSSGQNLTTLGTYIEMTSRLLEPTLLALAALAVRGRIKR
ncbi:pentapeptide repeat-containing protein [Streptomyces sp. NPDC001848]|uniref:pentapeptide repeat-containing protein n=1 Tax=Streptomyces sp. NPDC001848 TaxID=3364618 RepID=UPI0036C95FF4